jgi:hypothetical protein
MIVHALTVRLILFINVALGAILPVILIPKVCDLRAAILVAAAVNIA